MRMGVGHGVCPGLAVLVMVLMLMVVVTSGGGSEGGSECDDAQTSNSIHKILCHSYR